MPVPIHRYSRADVDAYLEEHAGITTADLTTFPDSTADLLYLPEYDAFYNFTSDAGPGVFICEAGRREGDLLMLTGDGKELTLEETEDGRYLFRSFLPEDIEILLIIKTKSFIPGHGDTDRRRLHCRRDRFVISRFRL